MTNRKNDEFHVSGYVIHAQPIQVEAIIAEIDEIEGAEIHGSNEQGKLVLTLETYGEKDIAERIIAINSIPGVINTALVYHQFDENS